MPIGIFPANYSNHFGFTLFTLLCWGTRSYSESQIKSPMFQRQIMLLYVYFGRIQIMLLLILHYFCFKSINNFVLFLVLFNSLSLVRRDPNNNWVTQYDVRNFVSIPERSTVTNGGQWLKWVGLGGSAPCSHLSPCNSMSPLIESIKCYFMPK